MNRQFLPIVTVELCSADGTKVIRRLRNDYGAIRTLRQYYATDEDLTAAPAWEALPRMLYAMTGFERKDEDSAEHFEQFLGPANLEYITDKLREASGQGKDDEPADPTIAPNGSLKPATSKRSKPSASSASESSPTASTQ
jgi:hypothetical protein